MPEVLAGQVALVTGGSRGIGKAIAATLAAAGAQVVLTSRSAAAAERTARELSTAGAELRGVALDVSSDEAVEQGVAALLKDYARIPILVNNAGITQDKILLRMKKGDWDAVLDTNLTGVYRLCRALVPAMVRARYGRIVNISSVVAELGNAGQVNYVAAKAGVEGLTRALALELASRNITVNAVAPGFIDTEMTQQLDPRVRENLLSRVPLGRLGSGADIAAAVRFLVGPGADYITGVTLNVNGGMHM